MSTPQPEPLGRLHLAGLNSGDPRVLTPTTLGHVVIHPGSFRVLPTAGGTRAHYPLATTLWEHGPDEPSPLWEAGEPIVSPATYGVFTGFSRSFQSWKSLSAEVSRVVMTIGPAKKGRTPEGKIRWTC
jgi:hypothetical protein